MSGCSLVQVTPRHPYAKRFIVKARHSRESVPEQRFNLLSTQAAFFLPGPLGLAFCIFQRSNLQPRLLMEQFVPLYS